jgi:hypothetical protein
MATGLKGDETMMMIRQMQEKEEAKRLAELGSSSVVKKLQDKIKEVDSQQINAKVLL